jgi:hypothetical protein
VLLTERASRGRSSPRSAVRPPESGFVIINTTEPFVIGVAVFSHWVLDFIVHRPDLPIYDDAAKVGLAIQAYIFFGPPPASDKPRP